MSTSPIDLQITGDALEFLLALEKLRHSLGPTDEEVEAARLAIVEMGAPVAGEYPAGDYEAAVMRWYTGRDSYRDGDLEVGRRLGFARLSWTPQAWDGLHGGKVPWAG